MSVWFDFYEDYCDFIAGGYIEWFDQINKETHQCYWNNYVKYISKDYFSPLSVCHALWPKLLEFNEFELEFSSSHFIDSNALKHLKRFIHDDLIYKEDKIGAEIFRHSIME